MTADLKNKFLISTDKSNLDLSVIHSFLNRSYWAANIPLATVQKSIENSLCFGVYEGCNQVGFARVITDYATFAYFSDVFILEEYRGLGLAKWLIQSILDYPEIQGLRRWLLVTADAQDLYRQFGFQELENPGGCMTILKTNIYKQ